jgi:hypothetical protein
MVSVTKGVGDQACGALVLRGNDGAPGGIEKNERVSFLAGNLRAELADAPLSSRNMIAVTTSGGCGVVRDGARSAEPWSY